MYIVLEGIDTAGKSTQIDKLKTHFSDAVFTMEPGATQLGQTLRNLVTQHHELDDVTEFLLFLSDRREHFDKVIRPALSQGSMLISDRSFISGIAYAHSNNTLDFARLIELNKLALNDTLPDAVVLFELPKSTLIKRLKAKNQDTIEARGVEYLLSVQRMLIQTTQFLQLPHIVIDASQDIPTIFNTIVEFITSLKEHQ